jgi:hypothetical protein
MSSETGQNMKAEPMHVRHADLEPFCDTDSPFKKLCPACLEGILLVYRDQTTMELINVDRCTHCGQTLIYSDETIGGEPVKRIESSAKDA